MPDYDTLDPEAYAARFSIPRERYLLEHWRPPIVAALERYCTGARVLDLGCGFGDYTQTIPGAGLVVGIDISTRWLRHARAVLGIRRLVRADAQYIPLRSGVFKGVVSVGLLEFVDPQLVTAEIARILVPGGNCVLVVSNKFSAFRLTLRAILAMLGRPYDRREPSLREVVQALQHDGLRPIEVKMDDGLVWLPDWLDRRVGPVVYALVERLFRPFGRNPFSNEFIVIAQSTRPAERT
jgi:SAM-dependent methyltransferase